MIIWVDDIREPAARTDQVIWCKSVDDTITAIFHCLLNEQRIEYIDLDHDAGDYFWSGGDYIKILDWLEFLNFNIPIRIHTMNPVGRQNMINIIERNNWTLIK